jgi:hypothetical protein
LEDRNNDVDRQADDDDEIDISDDSDVNDLLEVQDALHIPGSIRPVRKSTGVIQQSITQSVPTNNIEVQKVKGY